MAESHTSDNWRRRENLVWLAKAVPSMICSRNAASILRSGIDARRRYGRAGSNQLFNAANANF